jgi:hypothetical protein
MGLVLGAFEVTVFLVMEVAKREKVESTSARHGQPHEQARREKQSGHEFFLGIAFIIRAEWTTA